MKAALNLWGSKFTFRPKTAAAAFEDSAIESPESGFWRVDLGLVAQDRMCVSRIREELAARVCEQKEFGVNLDPRISRDLCRFGGLVEGKVN
jgi:hypothetical protein